MRSGMRLIARALAATALIMGLSACEARSPAPEADSPAIAETAPAPSPPALGEQEPPSGQEPASRHEDGSLQPAPSDDLRGTSDTPTGASPGAPSRAPEQRPAARAPQPMPTEGPSGVDPNRVLTPVLVELLPTEARQPRQGGSAVVLLAPRSDRGIDERRNMALCRELFISFDRATTDEVGVGVRRNAEGETELLRPLYWPTRELTGPTTGADRCAQRLATFDYSRAESIRRKLALTGAGPFLVVERQDMNASERVAAVIDLSRAQPNSIGTVVRYFRDGFMQSGDVWDRNRFQVSRARDEMSAATGAEVAVSILPRLVRTTRQVGCAFTNLLDACESATP